MKTTSRLAVIACTTVLAACGSDDGANGTSMNGSDNASTNNATANAEPNNAPTNGATNGATNSPTNGTANSTTNGTTNGATTANNLSPTNVENIDGETAESEPNDDEASATPFMPGHTLTGSVDDLDDDVFAVTLPAGAILDLEVVSVPRPAEFEIEVTDEFGAVPQRAMSGDAGTRRQFFAPNDGTYYVRLRDQTSQPAPYEIATRILAPTPIALTIPATEDGDLDDGAVDVYEFTASETETLDVSIVAQRPPITSLLDSIAIVYGEGGNFVSINDDSETSDTFDSELSVGTTAGEIYWIIVDAHWIEPGDDNSYQLRVAAP